MAGIFLNQDFTGDNGDFITDLDVNWEEMPWDISGDTTSERPVVLVNQFRPGTTSDSCRVVRWNVDPGSDEYTIEATWVFQNLQLSRVLALFVRLDPTGSTHSEMSYYRIAVHGSATPALLIDRVIEGSSTSLESESLSLDSDVPFDIRVEVLDSGIDVYIDDVLTASTDDTTISQRGRVAIGGHRGEGAGNTPLMDDVLGTSSPVEGWNPGLTATPVSSSQIDLEWTAHPEATGYDIERDDVVIETDWATTTYEDTGLSPETEYVYRVGAVLGEVPIASDPFARYRVSSIIADNNDPIETWEDEIDGHHLTQASGTKQPLYLAAGFQGLPCLEFDGDNDSMATSAFASALAMENTLVFIGQWQSNTGSTANQMFDGLTSGNRHALLIHNGNWRFFAGGSTTNAGSQPGMEAPFLSVTRWTSNQGYNEINGTHIDSPSGIGSHSLDGLWVGSRFSDDQSFGHFRVAEIIVYDRELDSTERGVLWDYAQAVYGIGS